MQQMRVFRLLIIPALLALILAPAAVVARAGPNAPFTLTWDAVVNAGGVSTGGPYTLADTVGQPAAGASAGGFFVLVDGFAAAGGGGAVVPPSIKVYLPTILK